MDDDPIMFEQKKLFYNALKTEESDLTTVNIQKQEIITKDGYLQISGESINKEIYGVDLSSL